MYSNKSPYKYQGTKGPQPVGKTSKKVSKPVVEESIIEEPAKIEVIDEVTEPISMPVAEETNGES